MARVQAQPKGLLSLFDLETDGRGPGNFSDTVSPTLDLRPFVSYGKRRRDFLGTAAAVGAVNGPVAFTNPIPQTEAYEVWGYSIQGTAPATKTLLIQPAIRIFTSALDRWFPFGDLLELDNGALANAFTAGGYLTQPILVPGNTFFGFQLLNQNNALTFDVAGVLDYVPLRV